MSEVRTPNPEPALRVVYRPLLTKALEGVRSIDAAKGCWFMAGNGSEETERREDGKAEDRRQKTEDRRQNRDPWTLNAELLTANGERRTLIG
jgi:hypothetical protein